MQKWFGGLLAGLLFSLSAWAAVDINSATQSELEAVKGIGPAKAKAIVEHRQKSGPFKSVDDLTAVRRRRRNSQFAPRSDGRQSPFCF
ncbi:MAG: competence protein ComEA [bacterium]|nr:MAG: competence protein ComEA [bacterium]